MRESVGLNLPRRRLLEVGVVGVLVLFGLAAAAVRTRGYALPAGRRPAALSAWQFVVLEHVARRIAAPDRGGDPSIPTPDQLDVAGFADAWIARMDEPVRRDIGRLLAYLEHVAPMVCGLASRFSRLTPADQDRVLASLEASSSEMLRAGFAGLKSLVFIGYYRDARTWGIVGYDGPLVGRPLDGWR